MNYRCLPLSLKIQLVIQMMIISQKIVMNKIKVYKEKMKGKKILLNIKA
jgi:hypothetical protein